MDVTPLQPSSGAPLVSGVWTTPRHSGVGRVKRESVQHKSTRIRAGMCVLRLGVCVCVCACAGEFEITWELRGPLQFACEVLR